LAGASERTVQCKFVSHHPSVAAMRPRVHGPNALDVPDVNQSMA
jgi:hypothetical protein